MSHKELNLARKIVTNYLKLDFNSVQNWEGNDEPFIERHKEQIFEKLKHFYETEKGHEFAFIAASLPVISGIIHVGSKVDDYKEATKYIEEKIPNADPASVLSALTFIYLVDKGINDPTIKGRDKEEVWKNMQDLVNRVLGQNS